MTEDTKNISNLLSGKTALQVEIPIQNIIYLSLGIFVSVLFAVIIANHVSKK